MITIDLSSRTPLYLQIITKIEDLAASGILSAGSQLPSVRSLAMELSINPNTIQRAYNELESKGIVKSLPGRGTFIEADPSILFAIKKQRIFEELESIFKRAQSLGIEKNELINHCVQVFDQHQPKEVEVK